ncbi:MAG: mechanosensitive ion channel domain-containing protein [Treponemataceae bacterium]
MEDILGMKFWENTVENWLFAAAFVIGGFIVGKIISWLSTNVLKVLSSKTKTRVDDIVLAVSERPLVLIVSVAGIAFGINRLTMNAETTVAVDKAFMVLVTIVATWTITRIVDAIIDEYMVPYVQKSEGDLDDQLLPILRKGFKVIAWLLATIFALKNVGYDVGALLAGLGLGGVAVALAAKDTLSNFFGSVAVFVDRPFKINERVKIAGYDGTIQEIGLRTSRLKTLDNRIVTIPNAMFAASPIENITSEPHTKVTQTIDLARSNGSAKLSQAVAALKEIGSKVEGTDGTPAAGITNIGEFSYKTTFVYYIRKGADYLNTVNNVNLEVLKRFETEGITLAYPTRSVLNEQK